MGNILLIVVGLTFLVTFSVGVGMSLDTERQRTAPAPRTASRPDDEDHELAGGGPGEGPRLTRQNLRPVGRQHADWATLGGEVSCGSVWMSNLDKVREDEALLAGEEKYVGDILIPNSAHRCESRLGVLRGVSIGASAMGGILIISVMVYGSLRQRPDDEGQPS